VENYELGDEGGHCRGRGISPLRRRPRGGSPAGSFPVAPWKPSAVHSFVSFGVVRRGGGGPLHRRASVPSNRRREPQVSSAERSGARLPKKHGDHGLASAGEHGVAGGNQPRREAASQSASGGRAQNAALHKAPQTKALLKPRRGALPQRDVTPAMQAKALLSPNAQLRYPTPFFGRAREALFSKKRPLAPRPSPNCSSCVHPLAI